MRVRLSGHHADVTPALRSCVGRKLRVLAPACYARARCD
jgi:ribosome-associated translation inhibitor RaiA